jgi:hypothetical protein
MDTLQTVADCIQRNDFGMLVDLTDCYLTKGLHPAAAQVLPVSPSRHGSATAMEDHQFRHV